MAEKKELDRRLGIKGWALGGRWGFERYLYTLHRITGLGLVTYFLLHILVTSTRAFGGRAIWDPLMGTLGSGFFKAGEFLVFAGFAIHGLNGIRLILIELGIATGKAIEPEYPYPTSVGNQRPLAITVSILAAVLIVLGAYNIFIAH
ncbi:succinate dehydrogenase [bacterium]|nr:succinate dehydrogenase [candidate division CSSED10-310 bacterium]